MVGAVVFLGHRGNMAGQPTVGNPRLSYVLRVLYIIHICWSSWFWNAGIFEWAQKGYWFNLTTLWRRHRQIWADNLIIMKCWIVDCHSFSFSVNLFYSLRKYAVKFVPKQARFLSPQNPFACGCQYFNCYQLPLYLYHLYRQISPTNLLCNQSIQRWMRANSE